MGIPLPAKIVFILKQGPDLNQIRVFFYMKPRQFQLKWVNIIHLLISHGCFNWRCLLTSIEIAIKKNRQSTICSASGQLSFSVENIISVCFVNQHDHLFEHPPNVFTTGMHGGLTRHRSALWMLMVWYGLIICYSRTVSSWNNVR